MSLIKITLKSVFGKILFEYESEENTIKNTLQRANLQRADLQGANLQGANLQRADLQRADLQGADLQGANLQGANLQGADLQGANLQGANLQGADLQGADLQGANLQGADLRGADLRGADLPIFCKWSHSIKDGLIRIGCETKSISDWDAFFDSAEQFDTPRDTPEFEQIRAVYLAYRAYLSHLLTIKK